MTDADFGEIIDFLRLEQLQDYKNLILQFWWANAGCAKVRCNITRDYQLSLKSAEK